MLQPWFYPLPLALLVILIGTFLLWKQRRIAGVALVGMAVAGLYLLSTPAISDALAGSLERQYGPVAVDELPRTDAIVVLGGGVQPPARPRKDADLGHAADRVWHGAAAYRAGRAPLVIVTGARPYVDRGESAAEATRGLLPRLGVPESALAVRGDSTSTREDALTVREAMEQRRLEDVLLVTSALHMPRAVATFRAAGIRVWPAATDHEVVAPARRGMWAWLPYHRAFARSNRVWHEYAGMLYYRLRGWV